MQVPSGIGDSSENSVLVNRFNNKAYVWCPRPSCSLFVYSSIPPPLRPSSMLAVFTAYSSLLSRCDELIDPC